MKRWLLSILITLASTWAWAQYNNEPFKGHLYNKECRPVGKCDALFYGHTHLWELTRTPQGVVCNLGSITFPKGGNPPTFATYEDGVINVYQTDGTLLQTMSLNE